MSQQIAISVTREEFNALERLSRETGKPRATLAREAFQEAFSPLVQRYDITGGMDEFEFGMRVQWILKLRDQIAQLQSEGSTLSELSEARALQGRLDADARKHGPLREDQIAWYRAYSENPEKKSD